MVGFLCSRFLLKLTYKNDAAAALSWQHLLAFCANLVALMQVKQQPTYIKVSEPEVENISRLQS